MHPLLTPTTLVGRTLGGFLIQNEVGSGGMGVVYRARDERLNRTVAIKVLHPKCMADEAIRERFLREGRTAALIDHPNVVRVLAAGEEGGIPYLVMEYVEGGTLDRILHRQECLSLARCLRIGKQLAEALASAHRVGVMHRDVKPANVLFTNDGEPKLADFGLAREEAGDHELSQTGILMGTPQYMSPEACEGRNGDARSDIYSLGVVLYAMLEKRLPFTGESNARILISQIQDPVPALTQAPPALQQVVYRALAKNPADRWSSASEFAAALERVLEETYFLESPGADGATPARGKSTARLPAYSTDTVVFGSEDETIRTGRSSPPEGPRRLGLRRAILGASSAALLIGGVLLAPSFHRGITALPPSQPPEIAPRDTEASSSPPPAEIVDQPQSVVIAPNTSADPEMPVPVEPAAATDPLPAVLVGRSERSEGIPGIPAVAKKGWTLDDGIEGLRSGFALHDPASLRTKLEAAGPVESADDRSRIVSALNAVGRLERLLDRAFARYRRHRGIVLDVRRADGPAIHGVLQAVDEPARRIYVESGDSLVNLSAAELSSSELAARALEEIPDDDTLLAALDLLLLDGQPREAWPVALRARRRGLAIEPDREALLIAQIPPADLSDAEAGLRELDALLGDPVRLGSASRDWLRKHRSLPMNLDRTGRAREAMRRAGGVAGAEDLQLYCAARVTGRARSFSIDYDSPEALLADFEPSGRVRVEPGELAALSPAEPLVVQLLKGLVWKEGVIEMEIQIESSFAVLVGWRGPGECFGIALSPARDGKIPVTLPLPGKSFDTAPLADGWIDVRIAWAPGKIVVGVNGTTRECPLPRDWSGEIGFAPEGSWSWRSLQVYGHAEFEPPAPSGEVQEAPKPRRALKASWGAWSSPACEKNELAIPSGSGDVIEWVAPRTWEAGADYRARFRMRAPEGTAVAFEFGTGDGRRRVVLGPASGSGFVEGRDLVRSGDAPGMPEEREVLVEIVVHRGEARIALNGRRSWSGHLCASNKACLSVGASGGEVTFMDLELWELEP